MDDLPGFNLGYGFDPSTGQTIVAMTMTPNAPQTKRISPFRYYAKSRWQRRRADQQQLPAEPVLPNGL